MVLYGCSTNPGKLNEFAIAARQCSVGELQILALEQIKSPDETGATFEENAAIKAVYYSGFTGELVFADDSGLEVDALGSEPGIFSARYAGPEATDTENNDLLLRRLENQLNRHARFICAIALARAGKLITVVNGMVQGEILEAGRGMNGFGYDPLFFYPPLGCAFGELEADANSRSAIAETRCVHCSPGFPNIRSEGTLQIVETASSRKLNSPGEKGRGAATDNCRFSRTKLKCFRSAS